MLVPCSVFNVLHFNGMSGIGIFQCVEAQAYMLVIFAPPHPYTHYSGEENLGCSSLISYGHIPP